MHVVLLSAVISIWFKATGVTS